MSYLIRFLLALVSLYCTDFSLNDILFIYNYYKSCTGQLLSFLIKVVSNGGRKGMLSPLLEVSAWNTWPHLKGLSRRCPILSVHSTDIQRAADQFPWAPLVWLVAWHDASCFSESFLTAPTAQVGSEGNQVRRRDEPGCPSNLPSGHSCPYSALSHRAPRGYITRLNSSESNYYIALNWHLQFLW